MHHKIIDLIIRISTIPPSYGECDCAYPLDRAALEAQLLQHEYTYSDDLLSAALDSARRSHKLNQTTALPVPSVYQQTGWLGPNDQSLCDMTVSEKITQHDFDFCDRSFMQYCDERGVSTSSNNLSGVIWLADHDAVNKRDVFMQTTNISVTGATIPDTKMAILWEILLLQKGYLQDAWEVYTGRRAVEYAALGRIPN